MQAFIIAIVCLIVSASAQKYDYPKRRPSNVKPTPITVTLITPFPTGIRRILNLHEINQEYDDEERYPNRHHSKPKYEDTREYELKDGQEHKEYDEDEAYNDEHEEHKKPFRHHGKGKDVDEADKQFHILPYDERDNEESYRKHKKRYN